MISILFPILSLVGAVVTVLVSGIHPLWGIPLFFSFLIAVDALFFLFAILVSLPVKKQDPPSAEKRPQSRFYRFLLLEAYGIALQFMRVRVTVTGKEHLPKPGETFLLVSNHLSNYDHMIMMVKLRRYRLAFVSKPENYDIPVIGKYLQQSAFLPIDRQNAKAPCPTAFSPKERAAGRGSCFPSMTACSLPPSARKSPSLLYI